MGRKKGNTAAAKEETRPFCFFCDRKFDDEQVLLQHQRAKHFRCPECDDGAIRGKCESVQGLIVHTLKIHAKALARVPNAMQGRDNPELNVYGMEGIPIEMLRAKGYARDEVQPLSRGSVEPPPTSQPQEAFNPTALLALPAFAPELGSSMLGAPGLPPPPGMPLTSMLGMPGLPAPPGLPDMVPRPAGLPDPKAGAAAGMTSLAPGLPGLPGMPGMPGMPAMLAGLPPFPDVRPPSAEWPPSAAPEPERIRSAHPAAGADVQQDPGPADAEAQSRGTKRALEAPVAAGAPLAVQEDVSVEELRAQMDRYLPSSWARGLGS